MSNVTGMSPPRVSPPIYWTIDKMSTRKEQRISNCNLGVSHHRHWIMYLYPLGIDGKTPNELVVGVALVDACRWPLEAKQKWQALDQKNQMLVSHGDE